MKLSSAVVALVAAATLVSVAACSSESPPAAGASGSAVGEARTVRLPPSNGRFDLQLGGSYAPAASVKIVDRDRSSDPVPGRYNLCYVNAFQTQDDEKAFWMNPSRADLLLQSSDGKQLTDPDWPDEYILDTSSAAKRQRIAAIEYAWIDGCAKRGYQAIDPDNLDTWTRFDQLTRKGNLALAGLLAAHAHGLGLAIGQKNAAELGSLGKKQVGFDFAVVEECQVYDECGAYTGVYGAHVLEIEYTDTPLSAFTAACKARGKTASVILRDRDVLPKGQRGYVYRICP